MYADLIDAVWRAQHDRALHLGLNLAREYSPNGDLVLTAIGQAESYLGRASQATNRFRSAIDSSITREVAASLLCRLAHTLSCAGDVEGATATLTDPRVAELGKNAPVLSARLESTRGAIAHRAGYSKTAIDHYRKAQNILEGTEHFVGRAHVQSDIAPMLSSLGHPEAALVCADMARQTFLDLDSATGVANAENARAVALMHMGRLDDAERVCRRALRGITVDAPRLLAILLGTLGDIQLRQKRHEQAASALSCAVLAAESVPLVTASVAEMHLHLGFALGAMGGAQSALIHWSRACEILLKIGNREMLEQYRASIRAANDVLIEDLTRTGDRARILNGSPAEGHEQNV